MHDLFWPITCYDAHNSLPFVAFDVPLRPYVSIARASNRIAQVMALIKRGAIGTDALKSIVIVLKKEMGIDLAREKWKIDNLVTALRDYELYLPTIFEIVPYNTGFIRPDSCFAKLPICEILMMKGALNHVFGDGFYDPLALIHIRAVFKRLIGIKTANGADLVQLRTVHDEMCYVMYGVEGFRESINGTHHTPLNLLLIPRITKSALLERLDIIGTDDANARVLRAYATNADITPEDREEFCINIANSNEIRIYDAGNNDILEYAIKTHYVPYSLIRRGFMNEIEPDPSLCADFLSAFNTQVFDNSRISASRYLYWHSFSIAIGLNWAAPFPFEDDMPCFIFGPKSLEHYRKYDTIKYDAVYSCSTFKWLFDNDLSSLSLAMSANKAFYQNASIVNKLNAINTFEELRDYCYGIKKDPEHGYGDIMRLLYSRFYSTDFFVQFVRWVEMTCDKL